MDEIGAPGVSNNLMRSMWMLVLLGAVACSDADGRKVYVSALSGTDVLAGLVRNGDEVVFYACGGDTTFSTHTKWFDTVAAETIAVTEGGFRLDAIVEDDRVEGTLTIVDGTALPFVLPRRVVGSDSDVFRAPSGDQQCLVGAIAERASEGAPAKFQGVGCDDSGIPAQVTPVGPMVSITADGVAVEVLRSGFPQRFLLQPVLP